MITDRYAFLKQLIDLYSEFESTEKQLDLLSFSQWMLKKLEEQPRLNKKSSSDLKFDDIDQADSFIKTLNEKARFLEVVSRVARYHEFYSRKALKDLVINTRLEFLFLQTIDVLERAKKTDLINIFNLEYTTGMDTIRRLNGNGLLIEVQDDNDKRAKLLVLTEKGKDILTKARKRMDEENKMFFSVISDNKWKKALPALEELEQLHESIYQNHGDKTFAELSNLIDSLKYLYK
ncbi:MAG TPA: MarR family winged helix-turn-helix transcriptional regulator [Brumimicrobium sp.]|nr:MarR family winged helix-turn-helix transcriptional regulator [Brumimicrobium sp.]